MAPFFQLLDSIGLDTLGRGVIKRLAKRCLLSNNLPAAADVIGTERIPVQLLPYFSLSETAYTDEPNLFFPHMTIFDRLREQGENWSWIGYPTHIGSTDTILQAYRTHPATDVAYLHFSELDWIGHRHGPNSIEITNALKHMDNALQELLEEPISSGSRLILFGDHGMVDVTYQLDLWSHLRELPLHCPNDYLFFLDSTQARFWFFSEGAEQQIRGLLSSLSGGHILDSTERQELHVNFPGREYGDLIFAIDGSGIIHPSFFSREGSGPKGMHGYLPDSKDNMTQAFAVGPEVSPEELGTIPMTQIYHLIGETLGLPAT